MCWILWFVVVAWKLFVISKWETLAVCCSISDLYVYACVQSCCSRRRCEVGVINWSRSERCCQASFTSRNWNVWHWHDCVWSAVTLWSRDQQWISDWNRAWLIMMYFLWHFYVKMLHVCSSCYTFTGSAVFTIMFRCWGNKTPNCTRHLWRTTL